MKRSELNLTMDARKRSAKAIFEIVQAKLVDHLGDVNKRIGAGRILCTALDLQELTQLMLDEGMEWKDLMQMVRTEVSKPQQKRMF
jgi:hypothetical protein